MTALNTTNKKHFYGWKVSLIYECSGIVQHVICMNGKLRYSYTEVALLTDQTNFLIFLLNSSTGIVPALTFWTHISKSSLCISSSIFLIQVLRLS